MKKRNFVVKNLSNRIARFQFNEICGDDRGTEDYLELIKLIDRLIVENVPNFGEVVEEVIKTRIHVYEIR